MKLPENMTEEQVLEVINRVINRIAPKYTFYGYTVDDIKQESYIICIKALERYDNKRPLENFISKNLSNRLKNFVRDNYFISESNEDRIKVLQPAQLDYEDSIVDEYRRSREEFSYSLTEEKIDNEELNSFIDINLPASMRMDYLKMLENVYIPKSRKTEIIEKIQELSQEFGYEKG